MPKAREIPKVFHARAANAEGARNTEGLSPEVRRFFVAHNFGC